MTGKRVDCPPHNYAPGDYGLWKGVWYGRTPAKPDSAAMLANLGKHTITEHADGSVTVAPSIKVSNGKREWHGFLEAGVWREC